ncbi:MAG TPA: phage minor capsid protein [Allocoleopsis sp.]
MNTISQVEIVDKNIYYDMQIFNNTRQALNLSFNEQRQYPLFTEPSDHYKLAIARFSVDSDLPTIAPQPMLAPNTDPNKLIYSWTMQYKTYIYQQYVQFVPQNMNVSAPAVLDNSTVENQYYWIYDAMSFINMLNTALNSCWNGLKALVIAGGDTLPNTNPNIYLEMNPTTYVINLVADQLQYDNTLTNYIKVYMNTPLHTYLKAFSGLSYYGYNNANGKDVMFNITNYNNLNKFTNAGVNYYMIYSEYSTVSTWSPVNSVVITSSLPVVSTLISPPSVIDEGFISNFPINSDERQVSDFIVETDIGQWNAGGKITYTAQIYRYISMEKAGTINQIQLNFYWKSKRGNYYNFELDGSGCASIKLLFEKIK